MEGGHVGENKNCNTLPISFDSSLLLSCNEKLRNIQCCTPLQQSLESCTLCIVGHEQAKLSPDER